MLARVKKLAFMDRTRRQKKKDGNYLNLTLVFSLIYDIPLWIELLLDKLEMKQAFDVIQFVLT